MSQPLPFETQNVHDDDAEVIDSLFVETDTPPDMHEAQEPILVKALIEPKPMTRILSGTYVFESTKNGLYSPIQILPADAKRVDMTVKAYSQVTSPSVPTATDFVWLSDENGKLLDMGAGRMRSGQDFDLSNHTGALWILPSPSLTANFEFVWWATTC